MELVTLLVTSLVTFPILSCSFPQGTLENRRIKTSELEPGRWLSPEEIEQLLATKQKFIDLTNHPDSAAIAPNHILPKDIPTEIRFEDEVRDLLTLISIPRMAEFVSNFSSYNTRFYRSVPGRESQLWLLSLIEQTLASSNFPNGSVSVSEFDGHDWFGQLSIIARIEGSDPTLKSEVIILGAHIDSVNREGSHLQAPGADDNASGSVVLLETLRILAEKGFLPKRSIEFHWYAAEELGLLGSGDVARRYHEEGVNVVGMVNFDIPGYHVDGQDDIGIYTDYTSDQLSQFLRLLVDEYLSFGRAKAECGYGCSDHVSWTNEGFHAAFPAEVTWHPGMHTLDDNLANVNFIQVQEFVKLAIGVLVEYGEPSV